MECPGTLKKAMTNIKGDDAYFDRLLSYFQSHFYEKIIDMNPLRKNIVVLKTKKHTYVLKGYYQYRKLRVQEAFTETLRKEGFTKTYRFVPTPANEPLFFEGMYFGCTKYIKPHETEFSYHTEENRKQGLELLEQFHTVTAKFESRYRTILTQSRLIDKWTERAGLFAQNIPYLGYFINQSLLNEMQSWAKWSLSGMKKHEPFFKRGPFVILHGDVAHHNFLREAGGDLYLIDFDLISIGPAALDYIQYANRILPYLDWSLDRLAEYPPFPKFLSKSAFLFALAYPADIFREWNRLIRENWHHDQVKLKQVMDLTVSQFGDRKHFIQQLKKRVRV